jgi:hypothetical protein
MSENTNTAIVPATDDAPVATVKQLNDWTKAGTSLRTRQGSLAWLVGDWYSQGTGYGKADDAVKIMDGYYSKNSLYQMGVVAKAYPTDDDRKVKVSMAIYQVLAATAKQDMPAAQAMLAKAAKENWTVAVVKRELGLASSAAKELASGSESDQGEGSDDASNGNGGTANDSNLFAQVMEALTVLDAGQLASVAAAAKARLMESI